MNRLVKLFVLLLSLAGWGLWGTDAQAANCFAVANANWNVASTWSATTGGTAGNCAGNGAVANTPGSNDNVTIGETTTNRTVTIPSGYAAAAATVVMATTGGVNGAKTLTLAAASSSLSVSGNLTVNKPGNTNNNTLNINAGTVSVGGNFILGGTTGTTTRDADVVITTGTLTITGDLVFTAGVALNNVITMSGAGTINLAGNFTGTAGSYTAPAGTLTPGTTSTVNFNGSTVAQTIPIRVSSITYHNIYVNNTNASGATLSAAVTGTNVTGDLRVQSGILNNGGFAIVSAGGGDVLEVANGAWLNLTGTSSFPTGYSTNTLGATSTVNYGGSAQTVAALTGFSYGNLTLSGSGTKTMPATAMVVVGNFTISGTATATALATLTVGGNWSETGTGTLFSPGGQTVTLNGTSGAQTITGTSTVTFSTLNVTNVATSNITLAATNVTVSTLSSAATLTVSCPDYTLTSTVSPPNQTLHSCPAAAPTVTTLAVNALSLSMSGATLNGTVSSNRADTAVTFDYWVTSGPVSSITAMPSSVLGSNTSNTSVSAAVTGLICGTTYNFHAKGVNSVGTGTGSDLTFTTSACTAPTVTTLAVNALSLSMSGATLNGTVSSNGADTTVTFDYWVTSGPVSSMTATPSSVLGSNTSNTSVSAAVTGLICGTTYNFHAKGVNSVGTGTGSDRTFTTSACPSLGSVINTYYPGSTASVTAGSTSIVLGAATGAATPIASGDTLLIMQMQDASMDTSNTSSYGAVSAANAGRYEYVIAASFVGGTLTLACGTTNAYSNAAATVSAGQKTYQVIRVPVYSNAILTASLTALPWNGGTGGVLAFDATGVLTLNSATVTVDGKGFRGGASRLLTGGAGANTDYRTLATVKNNGSKGEGIAGTPYYVFTAPSTLTNTGVEGYPNGSHGRGAPANGGGGATDLNPGANDENPGGGGGANGGTGGIGGIGWCPGFSTTGPNYGCGLPALKNGTNPGGSTGGFGGVAVAGLGATRLTLGGGGGGGTTNNGTGAGTTCFAGLAGLCSSGAAGGGIIMLRAGSMTGTATFNANGSAGDSTIVNDGSGGGGAGGVVLISAGSGMSGVTINVNGGKGGDNNPGMSPHGPGGGGGGGYAMTSAGTAACNSGGGSNGVTYNYNNNINNLFGAYNTGSYGATSGSAGSCVTGLTAAQIPGTTLGATGCLNHYELSVLSSSITCLPTTVTVTACTDNSNPCTSVATGVSGTANLATSGGTIITPVTVTAGVAITTLSDPGALDSTKVTVTLASASPLAANAATCRSGGDCSVVPGASTTFNTAGFIFSSSVGGGVATIPTQVAGTSSGTYYLRAVKTNDNSTHTCGTALTGIVSINFAYQCNDPMTCYATDRMTVNGSSGSTLIKGNPNTASLLTASWLPPVNMNFGLTGDAPFTFVYSDVGKVTLWANTSVNSAVLTGSSNAFVVRPGGFVLSGIPAAADATGAKFVKAGENFTVTVRATTTPASGALTTPNYGQEYSPESVRFVDPSWLSTDPNYVNHGTLGAGLGLTNNPAISGIFGAFINGVATGTAFTWNEVGVINLTPSVGDGDYLGTGADTIGTQTGNVGRFYAAKFVLSSGSIANRTDLAGCTGGCDTFTYMGEQMSALFTLTAKAVDGTTTLQNYNWSATAANQFAKLDPMAAVTSGTGGPLGMGAVDTATPRTPFTPCGVTPAHPCLTPAPATAGTFVAGVATVTVPFTIYRDNAAAAGPYALLDIGVAPLDSDGAALATLDLAVNGGGFPNTHGKVGSTQTRYGRLKTQNIYGSEKLPLAIPLQAQYWNGSYFINNADDSSTGLSVPGSGTAPPTGVPNLYFYPVTGKNQLGNSNTTASLGTASLVAGVDTLAFSAPGALHPGWLDIILQVPTYLRGQWGNCMGQTGTVGLYDDYPCARATFGVYGAKSPIIYRRENY